MPVHIPVELTTQLLQVVAGILGMLAVALARPVIASVNSYLSVKLGSENYSYAKNLACTVVRALEQSPAYKNFDGTAKKEAAIQQLVALFAEQNIGIDPSTIDKLIEEAVQGMNSELAPFHGEPLPVE